MTEGSPQTIIEQDERIDLPPILMMLKANDKNHPLEMQDRFIASYRQRGGAIEVHTFDGLPEHGMVPSPGQPETMRAVDAITTFIQRQTRYRFCSPPFSSVVEITVRFPVISNCVSVSHGCTPYQPSDSRNQSLSFAARA